MKDSVTTTKDKPQRFLFINPFGIGDVLFTTPVISSIKESSPESFIGYWCNERTQDILKNNPKIDKIFALSRGDLKKIYRRSFLRGLSSSWDIFNRIRKEKFEICLDFSLDSRYSLISRLAGIKKRIGFDYKGRGRFLTDRLPIEGYSEKHVIEYYLDLLKFLKLEPKNNSLELFISEQAKSKARSFLSGYGVKENDLLIGLAPGAGASWGKDAAIKHWPAKNYACLADKLISTYQAKIVVFGDASERQLADTLIKEMKHPAIDLVGKTNLEEFAALVNFLQVLITNDGGPLHIAAALGKKTVSFFGPVDPLVYGPYPPDAKRHIVLRRSLECSPCYRNFRLGRCLKGQQCLKDISPQEAFDAVSKLIHN